MAASHFLPSGPNSATPIRRRIGARIRTGRNACRPASSSNPSAVPSASLHTPPLLSQAVRRNAHMTPIRRSCPVSLRRPARVRSKELAGSDRVGPLYRLFRSAFGSGSAHSPRLYAAGGHTARMRSRSRFARRSSFLSSPFVVRFRKFRKFRLSFALICVNSTPSVKKVLPLWTLRAAPLLHKHTKPPLGRNPSGFPIDISLGPAVLLQPFSFFTKKLPGPSAQAAFCFLVFRDRSFVTAPPVFSSRPSSSR